MARMLDRWTRRLWSMPMCQSWNVTDRYAIDVAESIEVAVKCCGEAFRGPTPTLPTLKSSLARDDQVPPIGRYSGTVVPSRRIDGRTEVNRGRPRSLFLEAHVD